MAGIGCHFMVTWMNRNTATFSHMGGEGVAWIGQAPFTETRHVFVNLGDGTYFHSGILAIRAALAAKVNVTYKILYNDAVAMTGGQPVDGTLTVPRLAKQLAAEGVGHIVVVTDGSPRAWRPSELPHGALVRHRDELDVIQKELRECPGVSVLIYDQTCATELRRRRKRGKLPDPAVRAFIHPEVCEDCGDCSRQSNCLAVTPIDTPLGRKRAIDQSACNKDFSCLKGFCPSFVTVVGGRRKEPSLPLLEDKTPLPSPSLPRTDQPYGILITGVGGTGVITLGAVIGMAAHLDGKGVTVLDMTGLAQKGGAVFSHVRICDDPNKLFAVRIATGEADLLLGGDAIVSGGQEALAKLAAGRSRAVVNCAETPTAEFTTDHRWHFPQHEIRQALYAAIGEDAVTFIDATRLAERLLGNTIHANFLLLGHAWQKGLVPVSEEALRRAIELNGADAEKNLAAFAWGRRLAADPEQSDRLLPSPAAPLTLDELVADRQRRLVAYQDEAYGQRYRRRIDSLRAHPAADDVLVRIVAEQLYRLMAIKDEYEVARLFAEGDFLARLKESFEGEYEIHFHLAPPFLARPHPNTGIIAKGEYGPWLLRLLRWLAKARRLRGSRWDFFARQPERQMERRLLAHYEDDLALIEARLRPATLAAAKALAAWPDRVRGFGPVKAKSVAAALLAREEARARLA